MPLWLRTLLLAASTGCAWAQAPLVDPQLEEQNAYTQASQALSANDWALAELLLERVLMFNADHAQARLQLAMLLAQRGKPDAAAALIESLIADQRTPPSYRQKLQHLLAQLPNPEAPAATPVAAAQAPQPSGRYSATLGYATNPYARAELSSLTFTLADSELTLSVAPNIQPAAYVQQTIGLQLGARCNFTLTDQRWQGQDQVYSTGASLACQSPWRLDALPGQVMLGYRRGQDRVERSYVGVGQAWGNAHYLLQLFNEPATSRQGSLLRVRGALPMARGVTWMHAELEWAGAPSNSFAGVGVRHEAPLGAGATGAAATVYGVALAAQAGLGGYSPLLANNAARHMLLGEAYLRRSWALGAHWQATGEAIYIRRWSNLPLFTYADLTLQMRWTRAF